MNASAFRRADIYPNQGRNTAEQANQNTATLEVAADRSGAMMGAANRPAAAPVQGSPVVVAVVLVLVLVALRFFAGKAGEGDKYSSWGPGFYTTVTVGITAMLFIVVAKSVSLRLPSNNALRAFIHTV